MQLIHASYVRKCSNPDLPQQIDHNDSFKLDKACVAKGKAPPLLTAHEYMIAKEFDKIDTPESKDISQILVRSTILHGKLTELIQSLNTIVSRRINIINNPAVISVGMVKAGTRNNIIPEDAEIMGTIRTFSFASAE